MTRISMDGSNKLAFPLITPTVHPKRCGDCGVVLEYYDTRLRADGRQSPDKFWQPTIDFRMSVDYLRCMKCAIAHMRPK